MDEDKRWEIPKTDILLSRFGVVGAVAAAASSPSSILISGYYRLRFWVLPSLQRNLKKDLDSDMEEKDSCADRHRHEDSGDIPADGHRPPTSFRRRRNVEIVIKREEYSALMNTYIPDVEDWVEFGTNYLAVGEEDVTKAKEDFHGDELKEEILMCWIEKFGCEATVSRAYELAHNFKHDELEEVFRFLVQLIPDAGEWKGFAKHGLQLERDVYKEHEDGITRIQQIEMLRSWRLKLGKDASVEKLCIAVKTHFAGNSTLVNMCKVVMSPLREGQKQISSGVNYLCEAVKSLKVDVKITNHGTWTTQDAFIGCSGCSVDN